MQIHIQHALFLQGPTPKQYIFYTHFATIFIWMFWALLLTQVHVKLTYLLTNTLYLHQLYIFYFIISNIRNWKANHLSHNWSCKFGDRACAAGCASRLIVGREKRIEVIESAMQDKRTFDMPVIGVTYSFILRQVATRNGRCLLEPYLRLTTVMLQTYVRLQIAVLTSTSWVTCKSIVQMSFFASKQFHGQL